MSLALIPGQPLNFSEKERETLGKELVAVINDLETMNAPYFENLEVWWDWYDAKPLTKIRNFPWKNSSNIVVPLIRFHADSTISRYVNTMFAANSFWTSTSKNENARDTHRAVCDWINYAGDNNEFDLYMPVKGWIEEAVPIGSSVMSLNWRNRYRYMFVPGEGGKPKARQINLGGGPVIQQIPREHILWNPGQPIQESEIVVRQSEMSFGQVARMGQIPKDLGGWDPEAIETIKTFRGEGQSPGSKVRRRKQELAGQDYIASALTDPYDIRECHVDWPLLKAMGVQTLAEQEVDDQAIPIVVTLHKESGVVLRAVAKPYYTMDWTFYEAQYRGSGNRPNSAGLCKMLEHMQRASTTMLNQAIDAITKANSMGGVTSDMRLANTEFAPNKLLYTAAGIDSFKELTTSKVIQPDIALINMVFHLAQLLSGNNDPLLGQETRMGGHPSPASSTMALIHNSNEMFRASSRHIRHECGRMAEDVATLYLQHPEVIEEGRIRRALGEQDAEFVERWIAGQDDVPYGNMSFDLRAMSESLNPEQERNRALVVWQATGNYYSQILKALEVAAAAAGQGQMALSSIALESTKPLSESFRRVLEASTVDDVENFVLNLRGTPNAEAIQRIAQAVEQQLAGLEASGQGRQLPAVPQGSQGLPIPTSGGGSPSGFPA